MKCIWIFLFILSCSSTPPSKHGLVIRKDKTKITEQLRQGSVQRGKVLYRENCMACHGMSGRGDGVSVQAQGKKAADLRLAVREMKHFDFYLNISQWEGSMPGWKKRHYSEVEREDLVEYLKTFR